MDIAGFEWYNGNLTWLQNRTIVLQKAGSHSYGTATPTSDLDIKGVAVAPIKYYLGFLNNFEQAETRTPVDAVIYDIRKYFKLAADCNPNIIEQLWTSEEDRYFTTPAWEYVLEHRDLFLSTKAKHTFSGYAAAQLKRIKSHRGWLLNPLKQQPERKTFGLSDTKVSPEILGPVESSIRKSTDTLGGAGMSSPEVAEHETPLVTTAVHKLGLDANLVPLILAERRYANAMRQWHAYQTWKEERNPARAELEAKYGYDTKHAMHLIRLLRMGHEVLSTGKVLTKRPDAAELLAIRAGAWSFEKLEEEAARLEAAMGQVVSPLPEKPHREALDRVLVDVIQYNLVKRKCP